MTRFATDSVPSGSALRNANSRAGQRSKPQFPGMTSQIDTPPRASAPPDAEEAIGRLSAELGLSITAIGTIDGGSGVRLLDANGHAVELVTAGYRHF